MDNTVVDTKGLVVFRMDDLATVTGTDVAIANILDTLPVFAGEVEELRPLRWELGVELLRPDLFSVTFRRLFLQPHLHRPPR
jgi:hypothetical protein